MKPYYDQGGIRLFHADCLGVLPALPESSVDAVVTDPPYGLSFMNRDWDHGVPGVRFWAECLRVAKPGAFLVAFGGTRTYHRLACAVEDAGWEIRDAVGFAWCYGQGFPKSLDVSKAIDKAAGKQRERIRGVRSGVVKSTYAQDDWSKEHKDSVLSSEPLTDEAAHWNGWGTALNPAWEPIALARKPLSESSVAANVLKWGTGALNIDGCRIGTEVRYESFTSLAPCHGNKLGAAGTAELRRGTHSEPKEYVGRWPPNVALSHHPDCVPCGVRRVSVPDRLRNTPRQAGTELGQSSGWNQHENRDTEPRPSYASADGTEAVERYACVPECPVRLLDEQSGVSRSTGGPRGGHLGGNGKYGAFPDMVRANAGGLGDTGGASRFFYTAKASRSDRGHGNNHPTVKPTALCKWLCTLVCRAGGTILDPFMGSGSIIVAAREADNRAVGIDMDEESCRIATRRLEQQVFSFGG